MCAPTTPRRAFLAPTAASGRRSSGFTRPKSQRCWHALRCPQRWRLLYALAIYLYLRPGELAALDWADVNAAKRYVSVHQALDIRTSKVKPTKTGITRKVPIHPALRALLKALRKELGDAGRVVQNEHENQGEGRSHGFPPLEDLAATLRTLLERAKVKRADLHNDRAGTKRVTFYDLRATGITWEVLAGTDHVRIMQRAGHRNFSTTQGYIREAEAVGLDAGVPFPNFTARAVTDTVTARGGAG